MRKNIIILFATIILSQNYFAQTQNNLNRNLSPRTQQYLLSLKKSKLNLVKSNYIYSKINNHEYISAFIKVNNKTKTSNFKNLGVLIGTKAGNIWTVKIPVNRFQNFILLKNIEYIQVDEPIHSNLSAAKISTRVDSVQKGISLPQAYTGKNVVVGIIDVGFDYTHPTFYDTLGNKYRVKRIWEQKKNGTPPSNYNYGNEIIDTLEMISAQTDNNEASHGTHVAGIAAGSGYIGTTNDNYRGMAFESDLVFVGITPEPEQWTSVGMTDIIDGMNYIYSYAESQGKPAVANLSWGCSIGPNDGSSLLSQACDNLTGAGKIFTVAAGNNGTDKIHLQKDFTNTDTLVQSFISFSNYLDEDKTWLDIWGEENETFCIELKLYRATTEVSSTNFICLSNTTIDTFLIGSDDDTCFFTLTTNNADFNNNKPHAFFDIHSNTSNRVCITAKATSGTVNMWLGYVQETVGYYATFSQSNSWTVSGDYNMMLGEMACTKSAITVAAYASKIDFTNINNENISYSSYVALGDLVPFSSHGPTADYRIKPDITAPGLTIASAVNSFDNSYASGGGNYSNSVYQYNAPINSRDYFYAEMSGTSMATPVVAGIVALMLDAEPNLTPQQIKDILSNTAITDNFTTETPDSSRWGAGKINAYAAVKKALVSNIKNIVKHKEINIFPNPTNNILNFSLQGYKTIIIKNIFGNTCEKITTDKNNISLKKYKSGVYFISILNKNNEVLTIRKIIKL